jgi:putative transposase
MLRSARIDAPGALHHIIVRGIGRRKIFDDDADRNVFLERLGAVLNDTDTACFAWALIPNHFYLLLRTGQVAMSTVMRRLLTGYAMNYNRRHRRSGHLFQNRYKSRQKANDVLLRFAKGRAKAYMKGDERILVCNYTLMFKSWERPLILDSRGRRYTI